MQVFRLVDPGLVDRAIAFDTLPEFMLSGIKKGSIDGFPRHWKKFLGVAPNDDSARPFYCLDYKMVNADKIKWENITQYVRRNTDKDFRLLDKIEDMAVPLAPDSYTALELDPEQIPVIPLKKGSKEGSIEDAKPEATPIVAPPEIPQDEPKPVRRGRPKKVA